MHSIDNLLTTHPAKRYTNCYMRTLLVGFAVASALLIPVPSYAWSGLGDAGAGMTVDYNPGVIITATPQTITAGESTYVTFSAPLAIDNVTSSPQPDVEGNCTTNFSYTAIPAPGAYEGQTWGTMGATTDYPTATKTYTATCRLFQSESASGVTYRTETRSVTVTVNPAPAIDLTAAAVSPTNVTGGYSTTLSSVISNVGVGATSAGFTNLFQIATDASGTGAQDIGTYVRSTALSASSNFTATLAYTFPAVVNPTTTYVRACADKSSSANNGAITESSENNNCSPWAAVTISPSGMQCSDTADNDNDGDTDTQDSDCSDGSDSTEGVQGPTATLSANPTNVAVDGSSTLTWTCTNSTSASITPFGTVTPTASGSRSTGALSADATFGLTCTGSGGSVTDYETVTVRTPVVDIWADAYRVATNGETIVHWTSENALACSVSGPGLSSALLNGEQSVTITKQQEYEIDCEGATKAITINPAFNLQEF